MAKKRDSDYWIGRLKKDHPTIYARHKAGKFPSVRAACIEAGLIHPPTRLEALKREWKKASAAERAKFLRWAIPRAPATSPASPPPPPPAKVPAPAPAAAVATTRPTIRGASASSWVDGDGYLKPAIGAAMKKTMMDRRVKPGTVMKAMGFKALDARLSLAIRRRGHPRAAGLAQVGCGTTRGGKCIYHI